MLLYVVTCDKDILRPGDLTFVEINGYVVGYPSVTRWLLKVTRCEVIICVLYMPHVKAYCIILLNIGCHMPYYFRMG